MKPRNTLIMVMLIALAGIFGQACEKGPIKPAPVKDPRQYTWTIDTLSYNQSYQTTVCHLWGSSPKDIYAGGWCSAAGKLWHYDGESWRPQLLSGNAPILGINDLFGFSQNNLYAIGSQWLTIGRDSTGRSIDESYGIIVHFDGSSWRTALKGKKGWISGIGGSSPSNLWAGGVSGELYHYDGNQWKPDSVPIKLPESFSLKSTFSNFVGQAENAVYTILKARQDGRGEWYYLLRHNGIAWAVEDSMKNTYVHSLWMSPSGTLYATGSGVQRRDGGGWTTLAPYLTGVTASLGGRSDMDMLVCGTFGDIRHYNGKDWHQFDNLYFPEVHYVDVLVFAQEVFVAGETYIGDKYVTLILHGK